MGGVGMRPRVQVTPAPWVHPPALSSLRCLCPATPCRHPNSLPSCAVGPLVDIQNRSYLLPGGMSREAMQRLYPG